MDNGLQRFPNPLRLFYQKFDSHFTQSTNLFEHVVDKKGNMMCDFGSEPNHSFLFFHPLGSFTLGIQWQQATAFG